MEPLKPKEKKVVWAFAIVGVVCWAVILLDDKKEPTSAALQIAEGDSAELVHRTNTLLPKVINACPGIQRYAAEFNFIRAEAAEQWNHQGGVQIHFKVKDNNRLPPPLNSRSAGHHCRASLNPQATEMTLAKQACQSICTGTWIGTEADHFRL